jgi:hypothetical protein
MPAKAGIPLKRPKRDSGFRRSDGTGGVAAAPGPGSGDWRGRIHDVNQQQARQNSFLSYPRKKVKTGDAGGDGLVR